MNLHTLFQDPSPIHQQLFGLLKTHRYATTHQLMRFTIDRYGSESSAKRQTLRHLETLENRHLITRLDRRVGGWQKGSSVSIWALTSSGYKMVTRVSRRQRPQAISTTFLGHILATIETSLRFEEIVRSMDR